MKPIKSFVFAVLLLSALALNTVAGDIQTPGAAAPQPSPTPAQATITSTEADSSTCDPYSEQSGEIVETSDYLLFEAIVALFSFY